MGKSPHRPQLMQKGKYGARMSWRLAFGTPTSPSHWMGRTWTRLLSSAKGKSSGRIQLRAVRRLCFQQLGEYKYFSPRVRGLGSMSLYPLQNPRNFSVCTAVQRGGTTGR